MSEVKLSVSDKKWAEESDARTLAEAEAIRRDRKRMLGASRGAKRLVKDKRNELKGFEKVAKKSKQAKKVKVKKSKRKKK